MSDSKRPSITINRPLCRFYKTPKGCLAGASCTFLHVEGSASSVNHNTPSERCRFFAAGYCHRGKSCWFKHEDPFAQPPSSVASTSKDANKQVDEEERSCVICMEIPSVYGLLTGCSHVFCLQCLKSWRDPHLASTDIVVSGVHKQCPICRISSKFVTPSSVFYKSGDPRKETVIERYKESMKRIRCKYFERSPPNRRYCPFGKDCFYKHVDTDGQEYAFEHGYEPYESRNRAQQRRNYPHRDNVVNLSESDGSDDNGENLREYVADLLEALFSHFGVGTDSMGGDQTAESIATSINHVLDLQNGDQDCTSSDTDFDLDGLPALEDVEDDDDYEHDPLLLVSEGGQVEDNAETPRSPSPSPASRQGAVRRCFVGPPPRRRSGYLSEELDAIPVSVTPTNWEDESDDELLLRPAREMTPSSPACRRVTRHRRQAYSMSSTHPPLAPLELSRLSRLPDLADPDEKERTELVKSAILASSPANTPGSISLSTSPSIIARKLDSCQSEFEVEDEDMEELVRSVHKTLIGQSKG